MSKKYFIRTMGCQMNVHDSEKIAGIFAETGLNEATGTDDADVIVLNTCSIREKAEQKFYSELGRIRKMKKENPDLKVAVAGCIAQQEGKKLFKKYPYVDFVVGPNNIDKVQDWIDSPDVGRQTSGDNGTSTHDPRRTTAVEDNPEYPHITLPMKREEGVRAWVSIMYGCNNFCAYCVVPYTRGRERSRPLPDIVQEIRELAGQGVKEVTLLGQNVNSYGKNLDEDVDFPDLLHAIHAIEGIERIRFVTSHPRDFSVKLIESIRDLPKVCEHIHLPVQAGSDRVLKQMNRKYTYDAYKEKVDLLMKEVPGMAITTDIIAGFPGEDEDDFEHTMTALREIEYDGIFAFKYSERPGTKALELPDHIDEKIKSERLAKILSLQEEITFRKNKTLEGAVLEILVEGKSGGTADTMTGRTRTNKIVNYMGDDSHIGQLIQVKITRAMQHSLYGEKVSNS